MFVTLGASSASYAAQSGPSDPVVWRARFEAWVEAVLIEEQLEEAAGELPRRDPEAALRVLDELIRRRVAKLGDGLALPPETVPALMARDLTGKGLVAARAYARGRTDAALSLLGGPELLGDPAAAHLKAQVMDEATQGQRSFFRLATIHQYRFALSLSRTLPQAPRARVRIGQILLELGFLPEAIASIRPLLDPPLPEPHATAMKVTFAEATYRSGHVAKTVASIESLDLERLSPDGQQWATLRRGDSLFRLERYADAAQVYLSVGSEGGIPALVDGARHLRLAFSLIQSGDPRRATLALRRLLLPGSRIEQDQVALAGLLLARAHREDGDLAAMATAAGRVASRFPRSREAALAGVTLLESQRLGKVEIRRVPSEVADLVRFKTRIEEFGLLAYESALIPEPGELPAERRAKLAKLLESLRGGPVRALVHDNLAIELLQSLGEIARGEAEVNGFLLDDIEGHLIPQQLDENGLLLAIEAFSLGGRSESCAKWAAILNSREVRPIRRGIGAWREVRCGGIRPRPEERASTLLVLAESGRAGPFALALAALAAERTLEDGDLQRAVNTYSRALETFAEPRILGPALLRLGELEAELERDGLAMRHIVRGLVLTDSATTAADPLRKTGIVALAKVAKRQNRTKRLASVLRREGAQVGSWWKSAYHYLGFRVGVGRAPKGDDLFALAAIEFKQIEGIESGLKKIVAEREAELAEKKRKEESK